MTLTIPSSTHSFESPTIHTPSTLSSSSGHWIGQVRIKCQIQDIRIIMAPLNITYSELIQRIKAKFQIPTHKILQLYYLDEEKDRIILSDDDDLIMAMSLQGVISANPKNTLMIHGVFK